MHGWKMRTKMQGCKMRDVRHKNAERENAGLENATQKKFSAGKCDKSQHGKRTDN